MKDHHDATDPLETMMNDTMLETRLRTAMTTRAQQVRPNPELRSRINDRLGSADRRRRTVYLAVATAAVAVVGVALIGFLDFGQQGVDLAANPPGPQPAAVATPAVATPQTAAPAVATPAPTPTPVPTPKPVPTPTPVPTQRPSVMPSDGPAARPTPTPVAPQQPPGPATAPPGTDNSVATPPFDTPAPTPRATSSGFASVTTLSTAGRTDVVELADGPNRVTVTGALAAGEFHKLRLLAGPGVVHLELPAATYPQTVSLTAGLQGQPPAFVDQDSGSVQLGLGDDEVDVAVVGLLDTVTAFDLMVRYDPATTEGDGTDDGQPPSDEEFTQRIEVRVDGNRVPVQRACRDDQGILHVLIGFESAVTLDTTSDPGTVTISGEGFSATSDSISNTGLDGDDAFQIDATFPPGNEFGTDTISLIIPYGDGQAC